VKTREGEENGGVMNLRSFSIVAAALLAIGTIPVSAQNSPTAVVGIVKGMVTDDSSGSPLRGALVGFLSVRPTPIAVWRGGLALTDSLGNYSTRLDTGRYFAVALKIGYFPEWYNNVRTRDSASVLSVTEGAVVEADFKLHRIPPPVLVSVSGIVTDSVTGLPLRGALVGFLKPFHFPHPEVLSGGLTPGFSPPALEPLVTGPFPIPSFGWIARTDSTGRYTARVVAGATLIAGTFKFGYIPEFYDDKPSPFGANKLVFSGDTSDIDFDLVPIPAFTNSIAGTVVDSAHKGVPSHVLLIDMSGDPRSFVPRRIYYEATDSVGNYRFDHLPEAPYAVRAIPIAHYAPAWYDADSCGVLDWFGFDLVHVVGHVTGIDVCVKAFSATGVGEISGAVYQGSQFGSYIPGPGVGGTVVYALTPGTNQVVGFDVTDIDGSYSIQNLPPGSYALAADKEGYLPDSPQLYTLDAANNYAVTKASITISPVIPLGVGAGNPGTPREFALAQNYPNPFNPMTTISYAIGQASLVTLKVFDILGREVATLVNEVRAPGTYRAVWDAANYPSGVYTYRIVAGKFTDTRKMELIR
jgi:hypothetical protein